MWRRGTQDQVSEVSWSVVLILWELPWKITLSSPGREREAWRALIPPGKIIVSERGDKGCEGVVWW